MSSSLKFCYSISILIFASLLDTFGSSPSGQTNWPMHLQVSKLSYRVAKTKTIETLGWEQEAITGTCKLGRTPIGRSTSPISACIVALRSPGRTFQNWAITECPKTLTKAGEVDIFIFYGRVWTWVPALLKAKCRTTSMVLFSTSISRFLLLILFFMYLTKSLLSKLISFFSSLYMFFYELVILAELDYPITATT